MAWVGNERALRDGIGTQLPPRTGRWVASVRSATDSALIYDLGPETGGTSCSCALSATRIGTRFRPQARNRAWGAGTTGSGGTAYGAAPDGGVATRRRHADSSPDFDRTNGTRTGRKPCNLRRVAQRPGTSKIIDGNRPRRALRTVGGGVYGSPTS